MPPREFLLRLHGPSAAVELLARGLSPHSGYAPDYEPSQREKALLGYRPCGRFANVESAVEAARILVGPGTSLVIEREGLEKRRQMDGRAADPQSAFTTAPGLRLPENYIFDGALVNWSPEAVWRWVANGAVIASAQVALVWQPGAISSEAYAELVGLLGDLARAHGALGIERLSSQHFEALTGAGVGSR